VGELVSFEAGAGFQRARLRPEMKGKVWIRPNTLGSGGSECICIYVHHWRPHILHRGGSYCAQGKLPDASPILPSLVGLSITLVCLTSTPVLFLYNSLSVKVYINK
jgi:hypothetical protein